MNRETQLRQACDELMTKGNLEIIPVVFSKDYIAHAEGKEYKGHAFLKQFAQLLRSSLPDVSVLHIEFLNETEQTITWQRTLQGTHKVAMMGIPASHKTLKWNEMVVSRFQDGVIAEEWVVSELLGQLLLKQPKK